jgi:hypothetical protein
MKPKNLAVMAAQYVEDYKVRIMFNDSTWKTVDFKPFLFAYHRGYYDKYRKLSFFKKFTIEEGNIVWGKNWDLIFPIHELHKGKIKFSAKPLSAKEIQDYLKG